MRTCPNCGEQYPDGDIRTMCGSCMTPLSPPGQAPAPTRPQPAPPPQPEAVPGPEFELDAAAEPEPVIEPPPHAPPPLPRAAAARPRREPAVRVTQVGAGANARAGAWGALGLVAALVALSITLPSLAGPFNPTLSVIALVAWGAVVWCARQWSCYGWVRSATVAFPGRVRLGEKPTAEITLVASRPFPVDRVVLSLVSRERTVGEGAAQGQERSEPRVHQQITAAGNFRLEQNQAAALRVECPIPAEGPASCSTREAKLDWALHLWVAIPGWHADVRERVGFTVAPYLAQPRPAGAAPPQPMPLMDLAHCRADLVMGGQAGALDRGRWALRTGAQTPLRLTLRPLQDIDASGVTARLNYRVWGKGPDHGATVFRVRLHDGPLKKDAVITREFDLPALSGPLTYTGILFNIAWSLTIEIHRPLHLPTRAVVPITLLPGWEQEDDSIRAVTAGE